MTDTGSSSQVPRQLPAEPRHFVGRDTDLHRLTKAIDQGDGGPAVISAIGGAGGVGKTWLALRWAHHNADRFPDGQLFVNLRGYDPSGEPLSPQAAIRELLDALGVDAAAMPRDADTRVALYRSLVAGKRMLIMLDNAADSAQVVPLLPGGGTCTVVITSRDRLTGLVAAHGAHSLALDVLDDHEGRALLDARLGTDRPAAEPGAVAELLACCSGLPLALSIVAGRAQAHPELALAALAQELRSAATRLEALDEHDSVRAALSWSVAALTRQQADVFGLLGVAPGPDIGLAAAADLAGLTVQQTNVVLRALERVSLISQHVPGRFRMHDLTRLYAAEQAPAPVDHQLRRLFDHYTHTAHRGDHVLNPHRAAVDIGAPVPGCRPGELADQFAALAWFDAEHACLLATQQLAAALGWYQTVWHLAWSLNTYHVRRGRTQDAVDVSAAALAAIESVDDPAVHAQVHRLLGHAYSRAGQYAQSFEHLDRTLMLAGRAGDVDLQAFTHHTIAQAYERQGEIRQALAHSRQALALFRQLGYPAWLARAYNMVGWLSAQLGDYTEAHVNCTAALELQRRHHDRDGEASTLDSLGFVAHSSGRYTEALEWYRKALEKSRDLGHLSYQAETLERVGDTHAALGNHDDATTARREALAMHTAQGRTANAERLRRLLAGLDQADPLP
jgi:tetratricopeptide (TPR) repeat protein